VAIPFLSAMSKIIISFDEALDLLSKPINEPIPVTAIFSDMDGMTAFKITGFVKQLSAEGLEVVSSRDEKPDAILRLPVDADCTFSYYERTLDREGETALHVFFPRIGRLILFFTP
jgi:hypothetical protein